MKRTMALFLALLTSVSALSACSGGDEEAASAKTQTDAPTETTAETTLYMPDDLPDTLDYDGKKVSWFVGNYNNAYYDDFWAEEQNGSPVNDAVFANRRTVEDRLDVKLEMTNYEYVYADMAKYYAYIAQLILAGDDAFQVMAGGTLTNLFAEKNYFHNLAENEYLDLEKPWWNQSITALMPEGRIFAATGDGSLSLIRHTFCMFFNQSLLKTNGVTDDLYALLYDGKWTLDKLTSLVKDVYSDVNGDGVRDAKDMYGLTFGDENKYNGLPAAFGVNYVTKSASGEYSMSCGSERAVTALTEVSRIINESTGILKAVGNTDKAQNDGYGTAAGGGNFASLTFMENRALFTMSLVGDAPTVFAETDFEYGMLPYPKYDEKQEANYAGCQRNASFHIPSTCKDPDFAGAVLEAWSSEAYRTLQPEYFEIALKVRYAQDDNMSGVFDILRENMRFDFADVYSFVIQPVVNTKVKSMISAGADTWASVYAANESAWSTALEKYIASIKEG